LPPDVRYDGWNKKAVYDSHKIKVGNVKSYIVPEKSRVKQDLFKVTSHQDSEKYQKESLRQAQLAAEISHQQDKNMLNKLKGNRMQLEEDLQSKLFEALNARNHMESVTPQHQAYIEKLYLDLRLINPELALGILTGSVAPPREETQYIATGAAEEAVKSHRKNKHKHSSRH
jgi:hypothetical protein